MPTCMVLINVYSLYTANYLQSLTLILQQKISPMASPAAPRSGRERGRQREAFTFNALTMNNYPIALGDKIHIRAIIGGRTVLELSVSNVGDTTSLIAEIRSAARGLNGLSRLFVRNCSRGWAIERPFRFYSELPFARHHRTGSYPSYSSASGCSASYRRTSSSTPRNHTIFPWETH